MRWLTWVGGLAIGVAAGWACNTSSGDCSVGSEGCACTGGGACDPNLVCVSGTCVSIDCPVGAEGCPCTNGGSCDAGLTCDSGTCQDPGGVTSGPPPATTNASNNGTDDTGNDSTADDDSGVLLDVAANDIPTGPCVKTGCTQIDILFAIDSTGSMNEEVAALSASSAFAEIVDTLENLNCGVEYRVGVTNDNDGGFIGAGGQPWFDSQEMTQEEITTAFSTAANSVLGSGGTPPGCEHVLSSSLSTLGLDTTGFVRDDALLVLVLLTDVDDYGYYDQADSGGPCAGFLCQTSPQPVETIYNNLVTLKGGDPEALAAIVVAGDPNLMEGLNSCQQPATCCGVGLGECAGAHHAPRLWEFADMQAGSNGFTGNICDGASEVPNLIGTALSDNIDLACQTFEPEG